MQTNEQNTQITENKQLTETVKQIRRLIAGSMDGITATTMRQKGLIYKQNFGVALPRLREIARQFTPDTALSEYLLQTAGRETQIVGLLLMPAKQLTTEAALHLAATLQTTELAEIASMTLFCHLSDIDYFLTQLITSRHQWQLLTACCTATRALQRLKPCSLEMLFHAIADTDIDMATANAAYTLLQHLHDHDADTGHHCIDSLSHSSHALCQRIAELMA